MTAPTKCKHGIETDFDCALCKQVDDSTAALFWAAYVTLLALGLGMAGCLASIGGLPWCR